MSRWAQAMPGDAASTQPGGDAELVGVIATGEAARDRIPPGYVSEAINVTFTDAVAETRGGSIVPTCFRPSTFTPPIYGVGIFSDPRGVEWLMVATAAGVWQFRDGRTPRLVRTPTPLDATCKLVQGFDEMLLFRGVAEDGTPRHPWRWSGLSGEGFIEIDQTAGSDATSPIPDGPDFTSTPGLSPITFNSRMLVPSGRNALAVSEIEDYARYDAAFADYNLTASNDDTLTGLLALGQSGVLVGKDQSLAVLTGLTGDLTTLRLDPVNGSVGVLAGGTLANAGGDALFLGDGGVYRVSQVFEARLEATAAAASEPIKGLTQRINWPAAKGAVAAVLGKYYYLAVPLDDSERNNVILPFNLQTKAWEGVHAYPDGWAFDALVVTDGPAQARNGLDGGGGEGGNRRLYGVDFVSGKIHRLYDRGAHLDRIPGLVHSVSGTLATGTLTVSNPSELAKLSLVEVGDTVLAGTAAASGAVVATKNSTTLTTTPALTGAGAVELQILTTADDSHAIPFTLTTRSYALGVVDRKAVHHGKVHVREWWASLTLELVEDGVNATRGALAGFTALRTRYKIFGVPAYVATNVNDDHARAGREDYSADFPFDPNTHGVDPDRMQAHQLPLAVRARGRSIAVRILSTRGRVAVSALEIEGMGAERKDGTA